MREKEARTLPDMKSPAQSIDILFKADVSSNSTGKKTSTDRQRYKEWIKRVRELVRSMFSVADHRVLTLSLCQGAGVSV